MKVCHLVWKNWRERDSDYSAWLKRILFNSCILTLCWWNNFIVSLLAVFRGKKKKTSTRITFLPAFSFNTNVKIQWGVNFLNVPEVYSITHVWLPLSVKTAQRKKCSETSRLFQRLIVGKVCTMAPREY